MERTPNPLPLHATTILTQGAFSPLCLAPPEERRLVTEYSKTKKAVWNFAELKQALSETSYGKCAYCECRVDQESKYLEVEHFLDKGRRPDLVASWSNLLPSCKRCNGFKGTHDVATEPIVDPFVDKPEQHLQLRLYRLRGRSMLGRSTIEVLSLNDPDRLVTVRFEVGEEIQRTIESALARLGAFKKSPSTRNRNRLTTLVRGLLRECQRNTAHAATSASVLHADPDYGRLRVGMEDLGLWDAEFEEMHERSEEIVL